MVSAKSAVSAMVKALRGCFANLDTAATAKGRVSLHTRRNG
jgi:hypothetical protein